MSYQQLILVGGALGITGLMSYSFLKIKPVKQVELLRPRDRRGRTLNVGKETDLMLECKKVNNIVYRFIKAGSSYVFSKGGRMVTKFFAMEGTAYTALARGDELVKVSVADFLRNMWGDKFYDAIPTPQRKKVENDVVGITIEVEPIDIDEHELASLKSTDLDTEGDSLVLEKLAKTQKPSTKQNIYQFMVGAAVMASIIFFLMIKGWF